MDVIFETPEGKRHTIETWFFATVLEMKQNVEKYVGIPVADQTLVFNGQVMADERDTEYYEVLQGSRIQLLFAENHKAAAETISEKVRVSVKLPVSNMEIPFEVDVAKDTAGSLKERVRKVEGVSAGRFVLLFRGVELNDDKKLVEYGVADDSKVDAVLTQYPPPHSSLLN